MFRRMNEILLVLSSGHFPIALRMLDLLSGRPEVLLIGVVSISAHSTSDSVRPSVRAKSTLILLQMKYVESRIALLLL